MQFISAPATSSGSNSYDDRGFYGYASGFTVNKSYNASTGVLTISGVSQSISLRTNMYTSTQFITYAVYVLSSTEIKSFPLDSQWGINGNISLSSGYPTTVTLSGFVVGKKYLGILMSTYNSGSYVGATWTGATQNWKTWIWSITGYGASWYNRMELVCITATATTITATIGTNFANWIVIASEDGPLPVT